MDGAFTNIFSNVRHTGQVHGKFQPCGKKGYIKKIL